MKELVKLLIELNTLSAQQNEMELDSELIYCPRYGYAFLTIFDVWS